MHGQMEELEEQNTSDKKVMLSWLKELQGTISKLTEKVGIHIEDQAQISDRHALCDAILEEQTQTGQAETQKLKSQITENQKMLKNQIAEGKAKDLKQTEMQEQNMQQTKKMQEEFSLKLDMIKKKS